MTYVISRIKVAGNDRVARGLLDDESAIVTGAGSGMARGIAIRFARAGASVALAQ